MEIGEGDIAKDPVVLYKVKGDIERITIRNCHCQPGCTLCRELA